MLKCYDKPPLLIEEQVELLFNRGLTGISKTDLESILSKVSYYRLSGYFFPYQNKQNNHFESETDWNVFWKDYQLDSNLRILLFNAISYIEISLRTQLIYRMSTMTNDSRWYQNSNHFYNQNNLILDLSELLKTWNRSKEQFKFHYDEVYDNKQLPPAWMIFETTTFGVLSKYFENLKQEIPAKAEIANFFGFSKSSIKVLCSWLKNINVVRNTCAHHSRLFSKRFAYKTICPKNINNKWISKNIPQDSIFASICIITSLIEHCTNDYNFINELKKTIATATPKQLNKMGFPVDWDKEPLFN